MRQPWLVGLIVSGGKDKVSEYTFEKSAFIVELSREQCNVKRAMQASKG